MQPQEPPLQPIEVSPIDETKDPTRSSFRLDITLSIGYSRHRAALGTTFENNVTAIILLIGGALIAGFFVWSVFRDFHLP